MIGHLLKVMLTTPTSQSGQTRANAANGIIGIIASWGGVAMTLSNLECVVRLAGGMLGCIVGVLTIVNIVRGMKRKKEK